MKEQVFQRPDCMVRVKWDGDIAWLEWAASKDSRSLDALAMEVKDFLLGEGVKRVMTSVYAADEDGEAIYQRAAGFGFVPYSVCLQLVIDPGYEPPEREPV